MRTENDAAECATTCFVRNAVIHWEPMIIFVPSAEQSGEKLDEYEQVSRIRRAAHSEWRFA